MVDHTFIFSQDNAPSCNASVKEQLRLSSTGNFMSWNILNNLKNGKQELNKLCVIFE